MKGDDLEPEHHVVNYIKPSQHDDGVVDGSAFILREIDTDGLSVNWLEAFEGDKDAQLEKVRTVVGLKMSKNGRLAELNVGKTLLHLATELAGIRMVQDPLEAEGERIANPAHSLITGLPPHTNELASIIGDMIAEAVTALHPAVIS